MNSMTYRGPSAVLRVLYAFFSHLILIPPSKVVQVSFAFYRCVGWSLESISEFDQNPMTLDLEAWLLATTA